MKYILKYSGSGRPTKQKMNAVLSGSNAQIIDASAMPEMAVIELTADSYNDLSVSKGADWKLLEFKGSAAKIPTTKRKLSS